MSFSTPFQVVKLGSRSVFACGDISLLSSSCVSVAGARTIDQPNSVWLDSIISQCGSSTIVSGLALGADTVAHKSALKHGLPTIAVLPSGFNRITPKSNIKLAHSIVDNGGLLISEYHPDTYVRNPQYIARNRIIAELGKLLIMPQCEVQSGTMHTVRFANELNKLIVLPDNSYSGNQYLINNGGFKTLIK